MNIQPFWRAEVYTHEDIDGQPMTRKLFAGIYASRLSAEQAARRKCQRVGGLGFYVHTLDQARHHVSPMQLVPMEN